jgi:phytoene dehydrogenase-like protein
MTGKSPAALDVAIIGAGHNGLVCAAYLARRGLSVALLERRDRIGGAAVTEEFLPGFRNSSASYTVSLLHPKIIRELRLAQHGLRLLPRPLQNFLPLPDGASFSSGPTPAATAAELARHSARDGARLPSPAGRGAAHAARAVHTQRRRHSRLLVRVRRLQGAARL